MSLWPAPFHYCQIEPGVFGVDECAEIVGMSRNCLGMSGHLPEARECNLFWLNFDPATSWVFDRICKLADKCNTYGFHFNHTQTSGLQISRYRPGERYDWHMDIGHGPMSLRKLSIVVELSDPAEHGGRFEVFYGEGRDNRIPLRAGDAAIFPAWVMHRAVTPEAGERWTLAAWICGEEPFK